MQQLKAMHILSTHNFCMLRIQAQLGWVSCSLIRLQSQCQSQLRFHLQRGLFPRSYGLWKDAVPGRLLGWRSQLFGGSYPKATLNFLWLSPFLWHITSSARERVNIESDNKIGVTILCNIITKVTPHHLCSFLLLEESHKSDHTQGD